MLNARKAEGRGVPATLTHTTHIDTHTHTPERKSMQALAHTRVEASRGICRDAHSFTHKGAEARMWRVGCGGHACAGTPSNQLTGPGHLSMFASPHDTCSAPFA